MESTLNSDLVTGTTRRKSWYGALIAGVGLGVAFVCVWLRRSKVRTSEEGVIDDRGTGQAKASQLLRNLRERAFDADYGKLAMALGRPEEEVRAWDTGMELVDGDVVMKARGIALHRGIHIE